MTPPNSVEAEQSVLGAMMQDENAVLQAVEALSTDDFYQPAHREIFEAMVALHHQQRPIDLVTVDAELTRRGTLEGIGGTEYLMRLMSFVQTTANVKEYITLVEEKCTLRKLIKASQEISQECYSQQNPLQETLGHAEKAIFDIVMNRASGESLVHVRDVLYNTYANIEELAKLKGRVSGVPTGFTLLDNMLTGLHGGELIIIGARPSMGKTSFAMNIATPAALYANKSVAVFSLEMPREQIALRMLCSAARVNMQRVRQGTLREEDWIKLAKSIGPMSNSPVYIDDTAGITPTQLRSRCRRRSDRSACGPAAWKTAARRLPSRSSSRRCRPPGSPAGGRSRESRSVRAAARAWRVEMWVDALPASLLVRGLPAAQLGAQPFERGGVEVLAPEVRQCVLQRLQQPDDRLLQRRHARVEPLSAGALRQREIQRGKVRHAAPPPSPSPPPRSEMPARRAAIARMRNCGIGAPSAPAFSAMLPSSVSRYHAVTSGHSSTS